MAEAPKRLPPRGSPQPKPEKVARKSQEVAEPKKRPPRARKPRVVAAKAPKPAKEPRPPRKPKPKPLVTNRLRNPSPEQILDAIEHSAEIFDIEVIDPVYEAFKFKLSGMEWSEVAQRTGYATRQSVQQAVAAWLAHAAAEMGPERRAVAMELSVARHEAVLRAWWDLATVARDVGAAGVVARELANLDRVQRLDQAETEGIGATRTIVISGNPAEYEAQLLRVVEGGQ